VPAAEFDRSLISPPSPAATCPRRQFHAVAVALGLAYEEKGGVCTALPACVAQVRRRVAAYMLAHPDRCGAALHSTAAAWVEHARAIERGADADGDVLQVGEFRVLFLGGALGCLVSGGGQHVTGRRALLKPATKPPLALHETTANLPSHPQAVACLYEMDVMVVYNGPIRQGIVEYAPGRLPRTGASCCFMSR
jgi:hypothetical protein